MGQSIEIIGEIKSGAAVDFAKVASKDTAAAPAKCPMMNGTSKVKGCYTCPMHAEVMKKDAG